MNIPKTPQTENDVMRLILYGYSTEEVAKKCKASTGYVSGVANRLKEQLGNQEVSAIRELSRGFRKLGLSAANAFEGGRIFSMIKNSEIDIDELPEFLKEVLQKSKNENIDPSKLVYLCKSITQLQAKSNVPLEELIDEVARLTDKKAELEKGVSQYEEEANKAKMDADKLLTEKHQTIKSLEEFESTKKELDSFDLGFNNVPKLIKVLKQAAEAGYNIDKIVKHLEKEANYEQRIEELEQQVKQQQVQETILTRKVKELSKKIEAKKLLVINLRRLEKLGIKVEHLETLYKIVIGVANEYNIDEKEAIQRLDDDLKNNYHKKHGLKLHLEKMQNDIAIRSTELKSLQVTIENFNIKNNQNEQALKTIKTLKQKKIDPLLIIIWHKIFETSNLNPKTFEEKLQKFSTVHQLIKAEQQNLKQLTKEKNQLESNIEFLKSNKEKLESTISYGNELIKKSLDKNIQETINQIKKATEIGNNSIRITQENSISSIDMITQKTFEQMSDYVDKTQNLVATAMLASEKIGRLEFFIPLLDLVNGSFVPTKLYPAIISILDKLIFQVQRNGSNSSSLLFDIKQLREEMIKELNKTG